MAIKTHSGLRIVGGRWRGSRLQVPSQGVRPTSQRAREALFNILRHGDYCTTKGMLPLGAMVIDAFAGSGALGLEALSRGADHVIFLEKNKSIADLLRLNAENLNATGKVSILLRDAAAPGPATDQAPANLVLMDAPHGSGFTPLALAALDQNGWLAETCVAVAEIAAKESIEPPPGFIKSDLRQYGAARIVFFRKAG